MPLINVAVQHFIVEDAVIAFADAGLDQSVFCASVIQLQGQILGDDPANHTFEWEQTFGTPVTLVNPNTLFPSFVNPQTSDIEFTLYVDRNTPFETSDTVFISRVPTSTFKGSGSIASPHVASRNVSGGSFHKITGSGSETLRFTDLDLRVSSYSYNYPPDSTWQPIYSAEDLRRMKDNLKGSYWLMKDIDMDDLLYPWDPIGTAARPFIGDLHGNGFSIQNLSITSTINKPAGLFSYIGNDAVIEEISLTNANINGVSSSFYKGILAGSAQGYGTDDGGTVTVRNVYVEGTVDSGGDRAGGLIGHTGTNVGTLFENTLADVTVTGGGTNTGGWAGNFQTECSYNDNYWNVEKTTLGVGTAGDIALTGELDARTTLQLNQQVYYENWNFIDTWEMPFAEPFTDYADPDGWTTPLIQEWDSRDVDLTNITSTYTTVRMSGFAWSPDGTKLTIANTSDDNIKTFTCSTPWDPSTAGAPITSRGVTNPWGGIFYNADGTKLASITVVGDKISQYNATDYVMDNNTEVTALTKADAGLAGTQDGPFTVNDDMTQVYWFGDSNEFNRVSLNSSGDFDNFTLEQQATPITQSFGLSSQLTKISLDETSFYICVGAADNIRLYRMSTPQDTSTTALVGSFDLSTVTNQGWRAEKCWMDPNDTRFLWVANEAGTNGIQFAVLDTGVDTANRPAQLQNNIFDRVANAGTALETTGRQGVIWDTPTTTIGGENEFRGREYIGAVVQDQNPSTRGWENARFIPPEQTEALITQGRRHRVFAVIDMTPKSRATKELRRVPREASFLVQKTVMPRGTTQGNASFIGGSTKFTAPLGSADPGVQSLSITIVNPRKTTFLALDTVGIVGQGDHLPFTAFTVVRYEPTVFTQTDTVAVGYISEHSVWVSASSFTRVYGGSIG